MAFGFDRMPGTARNYINRTNPVFGVGQILSRKQYDKYVEQLGARTHLPGAEAMRAAEQRLEALRDALDARSGQLEQQARELAEREIALAQRERELAERGVYRRTRQGAGQRRYNLALDLYVEQERDKGRRLTKRDARTEPAFKAALADIKGWKNPTKNPNVTSVNMARRRKGFAALGGADRFKEAYERLYGRAAAPRVRRSSVGVRIRKGNKG
jgi:hypothetical protein